MDPEREISSSNRKNKTGGWITFPFMIGTSSCLSLAGGGVVCNLIVYLIEKFHIKSVNAAQIFNKFASGMSFSPLIGAILADAFLGSFTVISIAYSLCSLGIVLLTLTSVIDSLRPKPCQMIGSDIICPNASTFQHVILYASLVVCCFGYGISRFTLTTMGADQFDKPKEQNRYFNWSFFAMYFFNMVSFIGIVYIQDHVSWGLGYGICSVTSFIGLLLFLSGYKFYWYIQPQGSSYTRLARVIVATIQKITIPNTGRYSYYQSNSASDQHECPSQPTNSLRFLNKAAIITEGDLNPDRSIAKPWRLCSVQEVEDLKTILKILPVWSSNIIIAVPLANQSSLTVLQSIVMDRHLGHLNVSPGTIPVIAFLSTCFSLALIDRGFPFCWKKLVRKPSTPLQRIGLGHLIIVLSMVVSALVEKKRLGMFNDGKQMLAVWLYLQLILVGIGEGFYYPGQISFYYQEFPASLRGTATAMGSLVVGIAFYLSTSLVDNVRAHTHWLPNNINIGRLDKFYWLLTVIGSVNFVYFVCCAMIFKYQYNVDMSVTAVPETPSDSAH